MPAGGGAASNQVQSFMGGFGRTPGLPYDEYSQGGLDYAIMWWNPTETGKGKILFDDGTGRFMYIDGAKRYHAGQWKKGEPKLFDPSNSISQFDAIARVGHGARLPVQGLPEHRALNTPVDESRRPSDLDTDATMAETLEFLTVPPNGEGWQR